MDKTELLNHGFAERTYKDQVGVFYVKEGKVGHFPYAKEHIGDIGDVSRYDDAIMEVTPDGKVQFVIGEADYFEVYSLDSEEGQALLKDGLAANISQHIF